MVEQYWQRADGTPSTREHFLMALSDIQAILVKASYTLNTQESRISQVSVDVASDQAPPGSRQAVEVEEVSVHTEIFSYMPPQICCSKDTEHTVYLHFIHMGLVDFECYVVHFISQL